ncbi:MAG: two-component sensor histidine kinase [Natronospirillum sp.]|uniref:ATP-binding protein n=1 Tax=Natronospirillum sp. TaxID=2812955 RepID=UPI002600202A|nr:ATP-binding protein [Natronospirillum sp.]MCH8553379.1 two-component sensor histidine kinase [Natronospirillum sp.]
MMRSLGFAALWVMIAIVVTMPLWLTLPVPEDALAITSASRIGDSIEHPVALPLTVRPGSAPARYRLSFQLDKVASVYFYIPLVRERVTVSLNGVPIADSEHRTAMAGLASGIPIMIHLPTTLLQEGHNDILIQLESRGFTPAYLATAYVGDATELGPRYRLRIFILEHLKMMVLAGQFLMMLAVLVVWVHRPGDSLFSWMALVLGLSMLPYLGLVRDLLPQVLALVPFISSGSLVAAISTLIVVMLLAGRSPPKWLKRMALLLPAGIMAMSLVGFFPERLLVAANSLLAIAFILASLVFLAWVAGRERHAEAWLLLLPLSMVIVAAIHDLATVLSFLDGPVFLSVYYRPLFLIALAMILMRRLGTSLNLLDGANAYLTERLADQERQLNRLHEEERNRSTARVRSEERQNLTSNLHDGLSGHLVSIIAQSEREQVSAIGMTAREALEDLRLVIHSLDINDNELPLALAGLRERLERQLRRLGIELQWTMVRLPDIYGVTPTHALNLLRIIQEAITNAVKHGQTREIRVQGSEGTNGGALIVVQNTGIPFPQNPNRRGMGLDSMHRRVATLGGRIRIEAVREGTQVEIHLPTRLPDVARDPEQALNYALSACP